MARPESKFYEQIRKALKPHGFRFYRIENKLDTSMPDAFFTHPKTSGWIEFKIAYETKGRWAIDWGGRKKQLMTIRSLEEEGVNVFVLAKCKASLALGFGHPVMGPLGWPVVFLEQEEHTELAKCLLGKGDCANRLIGLEARGI